MSFFMQLTEKSEYLLRMFFNDKVRELSLHIGEKLFDDRAKELLKYAEYLKDYIIVSQVKNKLIKEYFDKEFKFENIHHPMIKEFLIEKLSKFENFTDGQRQYESSISTSFCLKYNNQWCNSWEYKKVIGEDTYYNYPYVFTETILSFSGYEKSKKELHDLGIGYIGGGSFADYIAHGVTKLKPHVLEAINEIKQL